MKNLLTIIKKELKRFFTDTRMLITLILPGVMIFVLYTIMGDTISNNIGGDSNTTYKVAIVNEPESYELLFGDLKIEYVDDVSEEEAKVKVEAKELDLFASYPLDFVTQIANGTNPEVTLFYNASSQNSNYIASYYTSVLSNVLQPFTYSLEDYSTSLDSSVMLITSLVPFLLITFLYSGTMAVAPESIAGEKERGTIANLLMTPVKRSTIALGKIIALSLVATVSAISSFIGLMLSLPKLAGGIDINLGIYGPSTYILLLLVLLTTVFIFVAIISLVSTYAKSIKEASALSVPLMVVIMLVGVSSLMGSAQTNSWLYLIPVYNSVNSLLSLFSLEFNSLNFGLTIISNLVVTAVGVFVLTRMFESEKIMFRK